MVSDSGRSDHKPTRIPARGRTPLVLACLVGALIVAGCGGTKSSTSTSAAAGGGSSVKSIDIASVNNIGDNGPEDALNAGLKKMGAKYHVPERFVYISDPSAYTSTLESLGRAHTSIVVAPFPQLQSAVKAVAPQFPDTKWIEIYADPIKPTIPNVEVVTFDEYKLHYLIGVAAAMLSKDGVVGYVGGEVQPSANADYHAYVAGAKSVNPNIKVVGAFVGSFTNPTQGEQVANSEIAKGVDVFVTDGAESSLGVLKAAQSAGALAITDLGTSVDHEYAKTVVYNQTLTWEKLMSEYVTKAASPGWKGGNATSGVEDGTAVMAPNKWFLKSGSPAALAKVKALQAKIAQVREDIIRHKISIPDNTGNI